MKLMTAVLALWIALPIAVAGKTKTAARAKGILLEDLIWIEAERVRMA